jgi:hypothetical protein
MHAACMPVPTNNPSHPMTADHLHLRAETHTAIEMNNALVTDCNLPDSYRIGFSVVESNLLATVRATLQQLYTTLAWFDEATDPALVPFTTLFTDALRNLEDAFAHLEKKPADEETGSLM